MYNSVRHYYVFAMFALFAIILILIQRKKSIRSLLRIMISGLFLYFIYCKCFSKINVIILSIITILFLSFVNVFIKDGMNKKSFCALISVIITSLLSGAIIGIIILLTKTFNTENTFGIVLGISTISLLGIYTDIISKITKKLDEEKNKTEDINCKEQFKYGINLGKDYITEKVGALILLFFGISIYPICTYLQMGYNSIEILNDEKIFLTITIAIIGEIFLVLSLPITSLVYAFLYRKKTIYKTVSDNKIDGKRSLKL